MNIVKTQNGAGLVLTLEGRLDTTTAPQLEAEAKDLGDITELTLDLEKLEYVSSAGLRVLLLMVKTMRGKGTMKITHANELVREVFEVTGFSEFLPIEQ